MKDIFSLSSSVLPSNVRVVGVQGREAISRPYRFEIGVTLPSDVDVDMAGAVSNRATLTIDRGPTKPLFYFNGIIAALELLHEFGDRTLYRVTLVPKVWQLTLTHHSRIFTDGSVPEIIEATLKYSGLESADYKLRLSGKYRALEHVCQYRESNFDFINRLMEREGIYYYFEQGQEREVMIITDHRSFQTELLDEGVRYYPLSAQDVSAGEALDTFTCRYAALPARVHLKDHDYLKPSLDVSGSAPVATNGQGEIVVYGDNFLTPDEGKRLAQLRSEEILARQTVFHGKGRVFHLRPGYRFTLEEHPKPSFNVEYLTTALEHYGNQSAGSIEVKEKLGLEGSEVYRAVVTAIPASAQYRPERTTPIPRVSSVVDAVVDGPAGGPYAEIDSHGRYKVRVYFDESDLLDGSASTWVRMLQPHGGNPEGFHFPLRKGTEVHLVFLGGDPDRPVIVGVAHDAHRPSAVVARNYTQNVIQTGGLNRMEMEDTAGSQYITVSTPPFASFLHLGAGAYNFIAQTNGNGLIKIGQNLDIRVGNNLDIEVGGTKDEDVTGSVTETYKDTHKLTVTGAVTEEFKNTHKLTVTGAVTEEFKNTHNLTVTGAVTEEFKNTHNLTVTGAVTEELKSTLNTHVVGKVTQTYDSGQQITIASGDLNEEITSNYNITVHGNWTETIDGKHFAKITGDKIVNRSGFYMTNTRGAVITNTLGLTSSNLLGAKADFIVGLNSTVTAGLKSDITLGLKIDALVGGKIEANAAFKMVFAPLWFKTLGGHMEMVPYKLIMRGIDIEVGGLKLIS
jgi:type VI secretion system secreted protein VgrG